MLRIICTDGSLEDGPPYLAVGQTYLVGRSSKSAFVVNDLSVSRRHAEVIAAEASVAIRDLASRNGTYLDRSRIETAEAKPRQVIFFANARFELVSYEGLPGPAHEISEYSTAFTRAHPALAPAIAEQLSKAERRVLEPLLDGVGEKEVAARLHLSQYTVHDHIKSIYRKLKVSSRPELLVLLLPEGK